MPKLQQAVTRWEDASRKSLEAREDEKDALHDLLTIVFGESGHGVYDIASLSPTEDGGWRIVVSPRSLRVQEESIEKDVEPSPQVEAVEAVVDVLESPYETSAQEVDGALEDASAQIDAPVIDWDVLQSPTVFEDEGEQDERSPEVEDIVLHDSNPEQERHDAANTSDSDASPTPLELPPLPSITFDEELDDETVDAQSSLNEVQVDHPGDSRPTAQEAAEDTAGDNEADNLVVPPLPSLPPISLEEPAQSAEPEPVEDALQEESQAPQGMKPEGVSVKDIMRQKETPLRVPAGTKRENPYLSGSIDPHARANRLAHTLVSEVIAYRKAEHQEALAQGVEQIKKLFDADIERAHLEYQRQMRDSNIPDAEKIFREAVHQLLFNGRDA